MSNPVIIPRPEHNISRRWISQNALRVLYRLKDAGFLAYLVGGGVRDLLLGREPKDFDIATDATPHELKRLFRNCRLVGRRFRLAHIHFHNEIIEVATFRSMGSEDTNGPDGLVGPQAAEVQEVDRVSSQQRDNRSTTRHKPHILKTEDGMILRDNLFGTPEEDARRRDFTVNALFYNIADFTVIDYVGGMYDLKAALIRTIGDPVVRFIEDPVRMVRAVRFAAMLGFDIEDNTYRAILDQRGRLVLASPARLYDEVLKLFLLGAGVKVYQLLRKTGLFSIIFPALNNWLDSETKGFPHVWIGRALEWVDACIQAGRDVRPQLLFALMFGRYVYDMAEDMVSTGMIKHAAIDMCLPDFLKELSQRVLIPRKVGLAIRDILWDQGRFEKTSGRHPLNFMRRPGFSDAFDYLRFESEVTGERRELRDTWSELIKAHSSDGHRTHYAKEVAGHKRRRGKKKRAPSTKARPHASAHN